MLPIVAIFIGVIAVAVFATFVFMVVNVLREGPTRPAAYDHRWRWRPPIANGPQLMAWAAKVSESVTQRLLARKRSGATASQLAEEVLSGTTFAINHVPHLGEDMQRGHCNHAGSCRMGVTAPEVFAIADRIRADKSEVDRIREIAKRNSELLVQAARTEGSPEPDVRCPLRAKDGDCAVYAGRPVACRAACHLAADEKDAQTLEEVARELGEGVEEGLSRGLTAAGLDGTIYELNSALVVALEKPDAADRWIRGEDVLAGCTRFVRTASAAAKP